MDDSKENLQIVQLRKENELVKRENELFKRENLVLQAREQNMKQIAKETFKEMQEKQVCFVFFFLVCVFV